MKRSEINRIINDAMQFAHDRSLPLPPFAYWGMDEWCRLGPESRELIDNMLGWDVTDFGSGDFEKIGLTVFTFRNGNFYHKTRYPKPYAEKLLFVGDGQILPYHYHWSKMEDIINRGGGKLILTLYNSTEADFADTEGGRSGKPGEFADTPVTVPIDGCPVTIPAGGRITLEPGQSITLMPGQYHMWQGVPGTGPVMLFEVSACNDDTVDNRFHIAGKRIPEIEEDENPHHLIFADYRKYLSHIPPLDFCSE